MADDPEYVKLCDASSLPPFSFPFFVLGTESADVEKASGNHGGPFFSSHPPPLPPVARRTMIRGKRRALLFLFHLFLLLCFGHGCEIKVNRGSSQEVTTIFPFFLSFPPFHALATAAAPRGCVSDGEVNWRGHRLSIRFPFPPPSPPPLDGRRLVRRLADHRALSSDLSSPSLFPLALLSPRVERHASTRRLRKDKQNK